MPPRLLWVVMVSLALGTLTSSEAPYAATVASEAATILKDSTKESAKEDALEEAALTEAAMQDDGTVAGDFEKASDSKPAHQPVQQSAPPSPKTNGAKSSQEKGDTKQVKASNQVSAATATVALKTAATPAIPGAEDTTSAQKAPVRPHLRGQSAPVEAVANLSAAPDASAEEPVQQEPKVQQHGEDDDNEGASDTTNPAVPEKRAAGGSSSAAAMENALTDMLLGKSSFTATPFGKSVGQIMNLIEKDMMPKVLASHTGNQQELDTLMAQVHECRATKDLGVKKADKKKMVYFKMSPLHKTCRAGEAGKYTEKTECNNELKDKRGLMKLKCKEFAFVLKKYGDQNANRQIVKKGGSEGTESYLRRITATVCGKYPPAGRGGGGHNGFLDIYLLAKEACTKATRRYELQEKKCQRITKEYKAKKQACDNLQDQMDGAACKRAVDMKDACETYAECYYDKKKVYDDTEAMVKTEEKDRQAEWRGLKRMQCLMKSFSDGKVSASEVTACKKKSYDVGHLVIKYPKMPSLEVCKVPERYPTTAQYKLAEFATLPAMAKGRSDANECTGVIEISTTPAKKSPKACKCERMTLNGPYSPGPLVRCSNCLEVRRSEDRNSCPFGTKIFSPRSHSDWQTIFSSVGRLQDPYFIVDVTRAKNGCGGCTKRPMNSERGGQGQYWHTSDGSPWWLRSGVYKEPNGNYQANCYLAMFKPWDANHLRFDDDGCKFNAKSYYCQLKHISTTPKRGSPPSCKCEKLSLTGTYSAGALIECRGCWRVSRSTQKNSCPLGTKIFSPANINDWKTFLKSAKPLRSPSWIIDVTRPQNGCGGCTRNAMNSRNPAQGTWRTSDGSAWWLRSTRYTEPNGDYTANCYLDLWKTPVNENSVMFNDHRCKANSNAYYCQPVRSR